MRNASDIKKERAALAFEDRNTKFCFIDKNYLILGDGLTAPRLSGVAKPLDNASHRQMHLRWSEDICKVEVECGHADTQSIELVKQEGDDKIQLIVIVRYLSKITCMERVIGLEAGLRCMADYAEILKMEIF